MTFQNAPCITNRNLIFLICSLLDYWSGDIKQVVKRKLKHWMSVSMELIPLQALPLCKLCLECSIPLLNSVSILVNVGQSQPICFYFVCMRSCMLVVALLACGVVVVVCCLFRMLLAVVLYGYLSVLWVEFL
jgi:hypothetical protein